MRNHGGSNGRLEHAEKGEACHDENQEQKDGASDQWRVLYDFALDDQVKGERQRAKHEQAPSTVVAGKIRGIGWIRRLGINQDNANSQGKSNYYAIREADSKSVRCDRNHIIAGKDSNDGCVLTILAALSLESIVEFQVVKLHVGIKSNVHTRFWWIRSTEVGQSRIARKEDSVGSVGIIAIQGVGLRRACDLNRRRINPRRQQEDCADKEGGDNDGVDEARFVARDCHPAVIANFERRSLG